MVRAVLKKFDPVELLQDAVRHGVAGSPELLDYPWKVLPLPLFAAKDPATFAWYCRCKSDEVFPKLSAPIIEMRYHKLRHLDHGVVHAWIGQCPGCGVVRCSAPGREREAE